MSNKYIIKNCPALSFSLGFYCDEYQKKCQDCIGCLLKQIVDYCLDNEKYGDEYYTRPILEKLDIQEIE